MASQLKNLKKVLNNLKRFGKEAENKIEDATIKAAKNIELDAKSKAPKDLGFLQNSINSREVDKLNWSVGTNVSYAPYQEFGTGGRVDLSYLTQAGYPTEYAAQFKGAGIRKVNVPPKPFLFPALIENRQKYIDDLEKSLADLTKKYN